ncbi:eukaryotic aspartyl protease family protein [Actinidia rufa]|uniref:Eukaryotic aspartyl protease family protein n=1 Tax=Actinidia rufa TaxID=165716 RepID=A0A7J0GTV0_9ERIC|nr:eukaryotic aspartyl protease family protein [Actinidia rufa]
MDFPMRERGREMTAVGASARWQQGLDSAAAIGGGWGGLPLGVGDKASPEFFWALDELSNSTASRTSSNPSLPAPPPDSSATDIPTDKSPSLSPPAATTPSLSPSVPTLPRPSLSTWTPAATSSGSPATPSNASSARANTTPTPAALNLSSTAAPATCRSRACAAAHSSLSSSDLCAVSRCPLESIEVSECDYFSCPPFYYAYADGSLIAKLYTDSLSIPMSSPSLILKNFTFGCANSALGEPIGVAGFGRGVLSLPAQLTDFSPQLGNQFSYCLVSHSFDANRVRLLSPLILGRYKRKEQLGQAEPDFVYTPMLDNPKYPYFYSVGLEAVSIGKRRIESPPRLKRVDRSGNGGMVVDSGTTFTILPSDFYESVVAEFGHRVGRGHNKAGRIEERTGLSPCYYFDDRVAKVPVVALHFGGNSSVVLPRRNYFYEFWDGGDEGKGKKKVGCVMLMNGGDDSEGGGPVGTLGNYQQQGFEVVYDLEKRRVGFARRKCASLWESLNQG